MIDEETVLQVIQKIPHECYRSIYGEIFIFRLSDFVRAFFKDPMDERELKILSRMIATELRELGCRITRQHDHRRVYFYVERPRKMRKRSKTRVRNSTWIRKKRKKN